jgi:hypothetical protein
MHPQQFRITGFKDLGTPLQRSCINSQRRSLGARSAFGKRWVSIADLGSSAGKTLSGRANGLRRWLGARGYGNARRVTTPGRSFENVGIQSVRNVIANLLYPDLKPGSHAENNAQVPLNMLRQYAASTWLHDIRHSTFSVLGS